VTGNNRASLRKLLTVPYLFLVLLTSALIGILSYSVGRNAVDSLSETVLSETTNQIAQAVEKHIAGSKAVLETAFPRNIAPPASVEDDLEALRLRLWLATSIQRDPYNYAYYGDRDGQFIGLYRLTEDEAELRLRTDNDAPRSIYQYTGIYGELENPEIEKRIFEPRERPWFKSGQQSHSQTWTPIYIDFKTLELVSTRARRVDDLQGRFRGVVATDLSLELLNDFLSELKLSPNGFAFIAEPDGNLIATSRGPHIKKGIGQDNSRLNASDSVDELMAATYEAVMELTYSNTEADQVKTGSFNGPEGEIILAGYARLIDDAGLDWIVAVAVPRNDFMFLSGLVGWLVLNHISRDLRQLARAARDVGDGVLDSQIPINRGDEIGDLARAFSTMRQQLLADRLTATPNRKILVRRIEERITHQRRSADSRAFAILLVDLKSFRSITNQLGTEAGEQTLNEIGQKIRLSLRSQDMAGCHSEDEFIVLLDNVSNRDDAKSARNKLKALLIKSLQSAKGINHVQVESIVAASIGIALCPDDGNDLDTLIKHADVNMYQHKRLQKESGLRVKIDQYL